MTDTWRQITLTGLALEEAAHVRRALAGQPCASCEGPTNAAAQLGLYPGSDGEPYCYLLCDGCVELMQRSPDSVRADVQTHIEAHLALASQPSN
jgi:hypothetical protein